MLLNALPPSEQALQRASDSQKFEDDHDEGDCHLTYVSSRVPPENKMWNRTMCDFRLGRFDHDAGRVVVFNFGLRIYSLGWKPC